jgi:hypothetical protein
MAKDRSVFGGVWSPPPSHGRGRSQHELQDRASFDNQKSEGCGGIFLITAVALARLAWGTR